MFSEVVFIPCRSRRFSEVVFIPCRSPSAAQVLWGEERAERGVTEKQSFVDLGCGNGLLVHILSNEGVSPIRVMLSCTHTHTHSNEGGSHTRE